MYTVRLTARQNPDLLQRDDLPRGRTATVATLRDASEACTRLIAEHDLGGGHWSGGQVCEVATGQMVAQVSYNGRVWALGRDGQRAEIRV